MREILTVVAFCNLSTSIELLLKKKKISHDYCKCDFISYEIRGPPTTWFYLITPRVNSR